MRLYASLAANGSRASPSLRRNWRDPKANGRVRTACVRSACATRMLRLHASSQACRRVSNAALTELLAVPKLALGEVEPALAKHAQHASESLQAELRKRLAPSHRASKVIFR